jgi:hypothetical protein
MSLTAGPGATLTAAATSVVPATGAAGAARPTAVAASDALGAGDVLEDKELCRKENYPEWNLATR